MSRAPPRRSSVSPGYKVDDPLWWEKTLVAHIILLISPLEVEGCRNGWRWMNQYLKLKGGFGSVGCSLGVQLSRCVERKGQGAFWFPSGFSTNTNSLRAGAMLFLFFLLFFSFNILLESQHAGVGGGGRGTSRLHVAGKPDPGLIPGLGDHDQSGNQ